MENTWNHYALADPRIEDPILRIRYIGRTVRTLKQRLYYHLWRAKNGGDTHRERWIRAVLSAGFNPEIIGLRSGGESTEAELIVEWRARGCDLTNTTAGGDGLVNVQLTPEAKERKRRIQQELIARPDMKAKLYSPEAQKKRGETFRRVHNDPEMSARMHAARRAKISQPEVREAYANRMREMVRNPENIEKRRQTFVATHQARREADPLCQQIRNMLLEGKSKVAIAKALGVHYKQVVNREKKMRRDGMMPPSEKRGRAEKDSLWEPTRQLLSQGRSRTEVSRQLGLPYMTVVRRERRMKKDGLL